jgi:acyl-CoA reductase-like NAD-dependent aldehyde dehydrogenase
MLTDSDLVSIQEVRAKVDRAYAAFQLFRKFNQQQVDAIVEAMAEAARVHARRLAEIAVEETGYGKVEDKVIKNLLSADLLPKAIRGMKTIGVLRELREEKVIEIGVPVGVVAAILPTTNPTSTAIYKAIIAVKAGNAIVLSPHPRARRCTCETAAVMAEAAKKAGAPDGLVECIGTATIEGTNALMKHPRTGVILSTGGSSIVKAAYSSGKPAFGVGPGNVPVLLDASYSAAECAKGVIAGKTFDYGTICSSEQTLVATEDRRAQVMEALKTQRAHICTAEQGEALAKLLITDRWTIHPDCVGQAPEKIARMAGFEVAAGTSILAVEIGGIGKQHPLSMEKLSPVLSLLFVKDWEAQIRSCQAILKFGGLGHTCGIYSNDDARIREYGLRMPAFRVVVNSPTPLGSTGVTTNLQPAMTLGCGAMAGNVTGDNVGPQHLMNIKRVAYVARTAHEAFPDAGLTRSNARPAAPPAAILARGAAPGRDEVISAVERYLAHRGLDPPRASGSAAYVESIVDEFLAARRGGVAAPAPAGSAQASCACGPEAAPPGKPAATAPASISPFVCEADVRGAIKNSQKIFIGPKTIVTPAARDLANAHDILVTAER